jgi:hypothetical protein
LWAQASGGRLPGIARGPRVPPSWSAGEIGIAATLGRGSNASQALALGLAALDDGEDARDHSLFIGTAGIGHALGRLHAQTGDPRFRDGARRWFARTIEGFDPGRGFGGYRFWSDPAQNEVIPEVPTGWVDAPGLGRGAAGVGLALLAASTDLEPAWDRILLLSTNQP